MLITLRRFFHQNAGFAGAEKALLTVVGLGLVLALGGVVRKGTKGANVRLKTLFTQTINNNNTMNVNYPGQDTGGPIEDE